MLTLPNTVHAHVHDAVDLVYRSMKTLLAVHASSIHATPALRALAGLHHPLDFPSFPRLGTHTAALSAHFRHSPRPADRSRKRFLAAAPDSASRPCGTIASLRQPVRALCTPLRNSDFAKSSSNVIRLHSSGALQRCAQPPPWQSPPNRTRSCFSTSR